MIPVSVVPVSVIIVTKNEEESFPTCLEALGDIGAAFGQVIVVDSGSDDRTREIAAEHDAVCVSYEWNGQYPKKRQWCLENLEIQYDWVFFLDADEVVTDDLIRGIRYAVEDGHVMAGYWITGCYVWGDQRLRYGLRNNKIALIHKERMEFPVVNDLDIEGMGEIEGHYQPVLKAGFERFSIGDVDGYLWHYIDDLERWRDRHERYARWESAMNDRMAWPKDPSPVREVAKRIFRAMPLRGFIAFLQSYIVSFGFLDGWAGLDFAKKRAWYYTRIRRSL